MRMQLGRKQMPAWILVLLILGAAAAAVAGAASSSIVLRGEAQTAVADKLIFEEVEIGIVNAGFEIGDLTGWEVGGLAKVVEVLTASNFNPSITPPLGDYFALLANGPDEVNAEFGPDLDGNGEEDSDTSILSQTFTVLSSATIRLWWSFLTSNFSGDYDDFFFIELNGNKILTGSVPSASQFVSPFPDTPPLDGVSYTVTSSGPANGNFFWDGRTTWQSFSIDMPNPGTYNLTIVVADQENHEVDTGVLIDLSFENTAVVHLANDRQSYMANFIADEGDTVVVAAVVRNLAGIPTVVKIMTDAPEYFDVGYSTSATPGDLGNTLRKINGEWVLFIDAGATATLYQHIWIKTKPPTPPGQYDIQTWIDQKFQ